MYIIQKSYACNFNIRVLVKQCVRACLSVVCTVPDGVFVRWCVCKTENINSVQGKYEANYRYNMFLYLPGVCHILVYFRVCNVTRWSGALIHN